jgi:hypothetical protein
LFGDRKVDESAAVVRQNHEDKQILEEGGRNYKEVSSDDILCVVF